MYKTNHAMYKRKHAGKTTSENKPGENINDRNKTEENSENT